MQTGGLLDSVTLVQFPGRNHFVARGALRNVFQGNTRLRRFSVRVGETFEHTNTLAIVKVESRMTRQDSQGTLFNFEE